MACHTHEVSTSDHGSRTEDAGDASLTATWREHVSIDTALLERLTARHREKHRRYHGVSHLEAVVETVMELGSVEPVEDLGAVVAAAFYHDAIYEPASPANERASARLARRDLATLGWSDTRTAHVGEMIEATNGHLTPPDAGHALMFDADLAILGTEPEDYRAYVDDVRAEYRHVGDDAWRTGRRAVVHAFLDRDAIYSTRTARDRWEVRARSNLAEEVRSLGG